MVLPQPLENIERFIQQEGRLSPYDASRFRKVLALFGREARKKHDVVLEQEIERLERRVVAASRAPPVRAMAIERKRVSFGAFADANVVWNQMSVEEREAFMRRIGFVEEEVQHGKYTSHAPLEDETHDGLTMHTGITWEEMLAQVLAYPRSAERRSYLREKRGGLRRVHTYRRWY